MPCHVITALVACVAVTRCLSSSTQSATPSVTCSGRGIHALFGQAVRDRLLVKEEGPCGLKGFREQNGSLSLYSRYDSCYTHTEGDLVALTVGVQLVSGHQWYKVDISCVLPKKLTMKPSSKMISDQCTIRRTLRVPCGQQSVSKSSCLKLGCCYDSRDSACYHQLNACSLDGHFVFSVSATDFFPPLNPGSLMVKGQPQCTPVIATPEVAIFKFGVTECGSQMSVDGVVVNYEVDVVEKMKSETAPFSLHVLCHYSGSAHLHSGYHAVDPPKPSPAFAEGVVNVQMRLAKDDSFTSFFPLDELPLNLPLRESVYVEVSISLPFPDPSLSLRLRDCYAYPASRHSLWPLLHDGCPNMFDDVPSTVLVGEKLGVAAQVHRFDVKTFVFLNPETGKLTIEEIYISCWVEICSQEAACTQYCSTLASDTRRGRRESDSISQLVSLGPIQLAHEDAFLLEDSLSQHIDSGNQSLYGLAVISAMLLGLIFAILVWSVVRKRHQRSQKAVIANRAYTVIEMCSLIGPLAVWPNLGATFALGDFNPSFLILLLLHFIFSLLLSLLC
ncbi:zona pellucida sperm-binding protein 4-like [Denticeps clupeoides]|uniref:zona pellucida sperm-binding protein 4-like n=1 Tax=Denticeps clupeoides TaxID=299321 RepID=UPI0010A4A04F|nr:zona pellucida sperm-binding protein 4-like [Denticeps clupeoides]